tara:strand:- start:175 stop:906 length:732 start_codon:yes stop_codon:yes gene_type:complete
MDKILNICKKYNIILLEDACESMGSQYEGKKLGNFGLMSCFSTYFGHHMSTIEGGLVCTNSSNLSNICKAVRSHGWDRDLPKWLQDSLRKENNVSEFNALYKFYYSGFNLRSTDLQAQIGLGQIDKLNSSIIQREKNYRLYKSLINYNWFPKHKENCFVSNFAIPLIEKNKDKIVSNLINNNIEVRPLICGSMGLQPFYMKKYGKLNLNNADLVDQYGFYIPNHPKLTEEEIRFVCYKINEVI